MNHIRVSLFSLAEWVNGDKTAISGFFLNIFPQTLDKLKANVNLGPVSQRDLRPQCQRVQNGLFDHRVPARDAINSLVQ